MQNINKKQYTYNYNFQHGYWKEHVKYEGELCTDDNDIKEKYVAFIYSEKQLEIRVLIHVSVSSNHHSRVLQGIWSFGFCPFNTFFTTVGRVNFI